jgi:hypothetical protein
MLDRQRHWCALCRYTGHAQFLFGTVQADGHESARAALLALWSTFSPHAPPDHIAPIPGELVLHDA